MKYLDLEERRKYNREGKRGMKSKIGPVIFVLFLVFFGLIAKNGLSTFLTPVSVFSKISGESLGQTDGYTNVLLLGLDRRDADQYFAGLTDTIIVASVNHTENKAFLFSIPRDLWVPLGDSSYGKVNSVYTYGGIELSESVMERLLGIPIHYYALVDFEGFTKAVDTLGGIDVHVDRSFDDYFYPIPGKENVYPESERYESLHFSQGFQHMDGETALKFARSRHALGPEGSDFARANRQQKVLLSAKEKVLSTSTILNPSKLKNLFDIFGDSVETNITVLEAQQLYDLSKDLSTEEISSHIIDREDEGSESLLYTPQNLEAYDGAWVLVPRAGDFSEIQRYIHQLLFVE